MIMNIIDFKTLKTEIILIVTIINKYSSQTKIIN